MDPIFPLCDIHSSHVKTFVILMRSLAFNCGNGIITATGSPECNRTETRTDDTIAEHGGQKAVKEGLKLILLDVCHGCSTVCQHTAERGHEWAECPLRITQVVGRDGQAIVQAESIKLSRMTKMATATACKDRLIQSIMKTTPKYAGAFELL